MMDYFKCIVESIKFIENNLEEPVGLEEISGVACLSKYHFLRIFKGMVGETPGDYLRRRRLTKAAHDLIYTNEKILDIALKYHFDSQETFHRSFKNIFYTTPGKYRRDKIHQYLHRKQELTIEKIKHLKNQITMEPTIKDIEDFTVIGLSNRTSLAMNTVPQLWQEFLIRAHEIQNKAEENVYYGICKCDPHFDVKKFSPTTEFTEIVGARVIDTELIPEGMINHTVKGGKFAVFTHIGTVFTLKDTYDYIWGTWVPRSKVEIDMRDDFELYGDRFQKPDNEKSEIDIYIPIK